MGRLCALTPKHCQTYEGCSHCGFNFWCCGAHTRVDEQPICHCFLHVWIDGCCRNNGMYNAKCGIGVWFADDHSDNFCSGYVPGEQTNQRAELYAAIFAIKTCVDIITCRQIAKFSEGILIHTDSIYVYKIISKWLSFWKGNGWRKSNGEIVLNLDLLMELDELLIKNEAIQVRAGHIPREYNECADKLSKAGARMDPMLDL